MGHLEYGFTSPAVVLDDRVLHYIQVVTSTKLRRHESFTLTIASPGSGGRETLWMQPSIPLRFVFDSVEVEKLDMSRLRMLLDAASGSAGIVVDPSGWHEPDLARPQRLVPAA